METLNTMFGSYAKQVAMQSNSSTLITEDNVYQEGSEVILQYLDKMVEALILPGSGVEGLENLEALFEKAEEGKSCLLLLEHYSNMDLSLFSYMVRKAGGRGKEIDKAVIAIAGMKLNEQSPVVAAFASAYTRIVIYPSRSLQGLDPENEKDKAEIARSNAINRAAMKTLNDLKTKGRLVLLFPSGTRYRPGDPSTKRGVREVDSYIKSFDYMCFVALNGEVLHVGTGDMMDDSVSQDVVRLSVSSVVSCTEFRDAIRSGQDADDKKQAVVDALMAELEKMHIEGEEKRKRFL
jgi:glycerol-3-phosphate O-acyltransferase